MKLNLGCGEKKFSGFTNIDISVSCNPDIVGTVDNLDPYVEDKTVDEIVAFDVIEHFDRSKIISVLNNWHAKLVNGGILVIRTVDIDRLIKLYKRHGRRLGLFGLYGERFDFPVDKLAWHIYSETDIPGMAHKWTYNRSSVAELLYKTGFSEVTFTEEKLLLAGNYKYADMNKDKGNSDYTNLLVIATK